MAIRNPWKRVKFPRVVMAGKEGLCIVCPCGKHVPIVSETGVDVCSCGNAFRIMIEWMETLPEALELAALVEEDFVS
jgi:hypothetical protein